MNEGEQEPSRSWMSAGCRRQRRETEIRAGASASGTDREAHSPGTF